MFTVEGLVKVKFVKGTERNPFTIRNSLELELLVAQYGQQAMDIDAHQNTQGTHTNAPNHQQQQHQQQQPQLNSSYEMLPHETQPSTPAKFAQSNWNTTLTNNNSTG